MTDSRIDEATKRYDGGDFQAAIEMLLEVIDTWPTDADPGERQRAQLYVASMYRDRGDDQVARSLLEQLEQEDLNDFLRSHTYLELCAVFTARGDCDAALEYLQRAEQLIDFSIDEQAGTDPVYLIIRYHISWGRYFSDTGRPREAIEQYLLARNRAISIEHRILVTIYLNLANCRAVIGERDRARDDLALAFSVLKNMDVPFASGLVHYFETLASFNLFVYDSQEKAIDCLSKISEKLLDNFDDYKRVFDFFGEVLVQRHEGKFDLEKLRKVKEYYNDPLIQAYLPSLIAGAPKPGEEVGRNRKTE